MRLLLCCLTLLAPALSQTDPASRGWSDAQVRRLCKRVADKALEEGGVGLSIGVGFGDRLVYEDGYGHAELEHDVRADAQTMFRIGSVTKQMTAALVMRQVEAGSVELDGSIETYLPEFDTHGTTVTVRQLLNHTSGIKSYTELGAAWSRLVARELRHEELLALFEDEPFTFDPGAGWHYNNSGYYLLGMLLENVEGRSGRYRKLIERDLARPLGLARTRYDVNSEVIPNRAQGYGAFQSASNDRLIAMGQPGAAGGVISTGGDLVRWQQALVSGRCVSPESYALMTTPTTLTGGEQEDYGFGLMLGEFEGTSLVHHGGGIFGFNSQLSHYPEHGLHLAVISNSEALNAGRVLTQLARALLGDAPAQEASEPDPAYGSPRLGRLSAELALDPGALQDFWSEVDGHTPLVESIDEEGWVKVTFLWRDAEASQVRMFGGPDVGSEKHLARMPDTDVWFRTEVLSTAARCTYAFVPDPPHRQPASWDEVFAAYEDHPPLSDPLNPERYGWQSKLELADAPPQPWIARREEVPAGTLTPHELASEILGETRSFSVYSPPGYEGRVGACDLVVLFDGEVYGSVDQTLVPTPTILDNLQAEGVLGPTIAVLVNSLGPEKRMLDLGTSEPFAKVLATELLPWVRAEYRVHPGPSRVAVGGSSLGGLMATFTAFHYPEVFGNVISQSGSYWWTEDQEATLTNRRPASSGDLIAQMLTAEHIPVRFWMEIGEYEGAAMMVGPNRHLRDVLRLKGHEVIYREFVGGHDYLHWRGSLGEALVALFGR